MSVHVGPEPAARIALDQVDAPAAYADLVDEVSTIRDRVALSLLPHVTVLHYAEDSALDALEERVATDLALRDGQFRQAVLLDDEGKPLADLLVGYVRGELFVFGQGLPAEALAQALTPDHVPTHVHRDHTLMGVDGPFAWELMAKWDSPGIIGLPYLAAFQADDGSVVLRAGRTGEFGYLILAPDEVASDHFGRILELGEALDIGVVGQDALRHCSLENWVFDIHREGRSGLDAMELQLRWRIDFFKEEAVGLEAVKAHRASGLRRRLTAVDCPAQVSPGDAVTAEGAPIGAVVATAPDVFGDGHRVLAVLDMPYAQSGFEYRIGEHPAHTRSAPWLLNRSLFVQPQKHEYAYRDEVEYPEGYRPSTGG
ncbi:MAG: aminomethyl transferase family protein [Deltaproteobacteria bacterium]|nr:MAG: aminomethyl transferase family protein [Deltaproteobacteria bacterium]